MGTEYIRIRRHFSSPKTNIFTPFICPQQIEIDPTINKLIYISDIFWFNRARLSVCYVPIRGAVATWPALTSGACLPSPKMTQPLAQFLWNSIHRIRVRAFFFKEMDKTSSLLNQIALKVNEETVIEDSTTCYWSLYTYIGRTL